MTGLVAALKRAAEPRGWTVWEITDRRTGVVIRYEIRPKENPDAE